MFGIKDLRAKVGMLLCDNKVNNELLASLRAEVSILKARLDRTDEEVRKCGNNLGGLFIAFQQFRKDVAAPKAAPAPTKKPRRDATPETKTMRAMKAGDEIILDCPAKLVSGRLCPIKREFPRSAYVTKALPGNRTQVKRVK